MEKKIKTLYILSIIAIFAFLGMQGYWLYSRYEFSLKEYEYNAESVIADALVEYNQERTGNSVTQIQTTYNLSHSVDSIGKQQRKVTVASTTIQGRELLGIKEDRKLTQEEMERLAKIVSDSLNAVENKRATLDVSNAPSDGAAWSAMKNFELEFQSPFTVDGIDSLLAKAGVNAEVSLIQTDSLIWSPILTYHSSILHPRFSFISPYSELESKAVLIDCEIPTASIIKGMGWTLVMAFILSMLLILCLVWQIKTIVKLTRLDKMRNSFITTMIHELKRPISTLKMCVSGIENEKMLADEEMKIELMSSTRTALDNLSAYFSKLRDITFNNVEQIPLNITKFNLYRLVDDVISSVAVPGGKIVKFENNIGNELEVSADRSHLFNITTNLIENSIKYSGDGVVITIEAHSVENGVTLSVSDTGYGISESDLKKIFVRFYRGKVSATDIPGMGLGLAYVKLLTEAHGGTVTVMSRQNEGSSFIINMPQ
ncbi:MAG: HAMP domain-containing histidine kinase [Bacteroides sp.]|nr:HAMP domain-containing histidine kinase [Bacteroides sp.]MCM1390043.1 HAMP domain-containing histidine kinase [Bacteroides sp.]